MSSNSSGLGWQVGLYAKFDKPNASYEKSWFAIGKPLLLERIDGGPVGFSLNPRAQKITLFAQTLSAQYALPPKVFDAFDKSARAFILLNTGTAKLETAAYVRGFEIYHGAFREGNPAAKQ